VISKFFAICLNRTRSTLRRAGALPPLPSAEVFGHEGQAMSRECLICKKRFNSAWTGQRICDDCKTADGGKPA
jgi:hypothetical protein